MNHKKSKCLFFKEGWCSTRRAKEGRRREVNDAELHQAVRELNTSVNEVVRYLNNRSDFFIVDVGAFEIRFELAKLGKPKEGAAS